MYIIRVDMHAGAHYMDGPSGVSTSVASATRYTNTDSIEYEIGRLRQYFDNCPITAIHIPEIDETVEELCTL